MAPRKNVVRASKYQGSVCEKENSYLRGLSDYKAKVRRRESLRTLRCLKVSDKFLGVALECAELLLLSRLFVMVLKYFPQECMMCN